MEGRGPYYRGEESWGPQSGDGGQQPGGECSCEAGTTWLLFCSGGCPDVVVTIFREVTPGKCV